MYHAKLPASVLTKELCLQELKQLADEIRLELSSLMSRTQKPFRSSLAVVELTVAIHYVFHAPMDKILWDDGAQVRPLSIHFFLWECMVVGEEGRWFRGRKHSDCLLYSILCECC